MITEQELKDKCTPEFIKWMCEFAEGFELRQSISTMMLYFKPQPQITTSIHAKDLFEPDNILILSTLIHRVVEGWNKTNDLKIRIFDEEIHTKKRLDHFAIGFYQFKNYQPQSLTQAECAELDCLLDVFETGGEI